MASPRRLVLFVEGEGEQEAAPILVKKLLTEMGGWAYLSLDPHPFRVGNVADLTKEEGKDWKRLLGAAGKRPNLGAVLLLLDGDLDRIRKEVFCATVFAQRLAQWARDVGGGALFSAAVVFACQEYESWLLACADQLAGQVLPDGRPGIRAGTIAPTGDLEKAPRGAKGWLDQSIEAGYKPTRDQGPFTQLMVNHLDAVRQRGMRSFRRLESALRQLIDAVKAGKHVVTPQVSAPS